MEIIMKPKEKPRLAAPKLRKAAALPTKTVQKLLTDQVHIRQGNFIRTNGEAEEATEYGDRQIRQTVQGTVHTVNRTIQ